MKFRVFCLLAVISTFFTTSGFVCATRVEKMEADIEALQLQFNEIQKRVNNDQTQLTEMILRADKKLEELGSSQDQTHDRVSQQNVQLAIELEQERAEMAALRGRLEVQQKALSDMQESLQSVMSSMTVSQTSSNAVLLPPDQNGLIAFIAEKQAAGDRDSAKMGMDEFLSRYPNAPQNEGYLFALAQNEAASGRDREAIAYATRYLQSFPKGDNRNEIIYIMGDSGLKVGNCDLAQKSFQTLSALKYRDSATRLKDAKKCK